jgi:predicted phage tail protein
MKNQPYNVLRHGDWDHAPRAAAVGAAILGASAASTAIFTIGGFTLTAGMLVGGLVVNLVTSWAMRALSPKPPEMSSFGGDTSSRGILINQKDPASPHEFVYGQTRKGGIITYYEATGTNNKFLHQIIALAGHEVEEIGDIYINDEVVTLDGNGFVTSKPWNSKIRINKHLGTANQTADADLLAETNNDDIDANFRGRGIAYIYVRYQYDQDIFANGIPLITAVVKGKKVYDPRTATTAYSNNAALCIRDYLTSAYGLSDSDIDDTVFAAAANICDENVTLSGGGTEKKYTINGITRADINHGDVLGDMMTACAGALFWGAGNWKLTVGDYVAPTKVLTLDDLRSPISLTTRINLRDQFNAVQGTFNDASERWIVTDYPSYTSPNFVAEDNNQQTLLDLELPFTTSSAMAQRLAKLTLYRGREQMTIQADFGMNAFDVEVGEIIALTNERYGWDEKEFEVTNWSFKSGESGALVVSLTLRETSEAAFDWNADETQIIQNNTTLLPFNEVPPLGIALSSGFTLSNEQLVNLINVNVTAGAFQQVDRVEVEFKKSSETTYRAIGSGQVGAYQIVGIDAGSTYDVRVRAINAFGVKGEFTTQSIFVSPVILDVDNVTAFGAHVLDDQISLDWTPVDDQALSFFKIRHSIATSGATWSDATTYIEKVSRPATSATGPAMSGTYMIRAFDKTGQPSANYTSVVVSDAFLREYATTLSETDTTFAGTKTDTTITDTELRLTSSATSGEYELSNYIDIGSVKRARTYVQVDTRRFNADGDTWDNMTGTWDTWVGTWDDWTGTAVQQADTNVEWYVATTNDDPAGTPTWSDWTRIKSATIKARAFKYKLVLKSLYAGVTPSVSSIVAYVEHD